jgi:uncharacterized damage-inducible protein DinB
MYNKVDDFVNSYSHESQVTSSQLDALTDESLNRPKAEGHSNLGQIALHIAQAPIQILNQHGLGVEDKPVPEPLTAKFIADEYRRTSAAVIAGVKAKWNDAQLHDTANIFGMEMPLGKWLHALEKHEVHHRGQLSVLQRQAGLPVPSIYGPNKEQTDQMMAAGTMPGQDNGGDSNQAAQG